MIRQFISFSIAMFMAMNCAFSQDVLQQLTSFNPLKDTGFYSAVTNNPIRDYSFSKKAPQDTSVSEGYFADVAPLVYVHIYGGIGFSFMSSSDIESMLVDEFGIGIGLPTWSWGFIGGYQNIVQVEYNNGISDHDFNKPSIIKDNPSEVIKMDYRTTDLQFKFNPLFWNMAGNRAIFLIYGTGDVEWRDDNNDGFTGTTQIFGVEYAQISKNVSWSASFKRYGNTFEKTIVFTIPLEEETQASDYILEFKVGIGLGM